MIQYILYVFLIAIMVITVIGFLNRTNREGFRADLFSRFHYEPRGDSWSRLVEVNPRLHRGRASKWYNQTGPVKFIMGRPYRFYRMPGWANPWHFPEDRDDTCRQYAEHRCGQQLTGKRQIVNPSDCFERAYTWCKTNPGADLIV